MLPIPKERGKTDTLNEEFMRRCRPCPGVGGALAAAFELAA